MVRSFESCLHFHIPHGGQQLEFARVPCVMLVYRQERGAKMNNIHMTLSVNVVHVKVSVVILWQQNGRDWLCSCFYFCQVSTMSAWLATIQHAGFCHVAMLVGGEVKEATLKQYLLGRRTQKANQISLLSKKEIKCLYEFFEWENYDPGWIIK